MTQTAQRIDTGLAAASRVIAPSQGEIDAAMETLQRLKNIQGTAPDAAGNVTAAVTPASRRPRRRANPENTMATATPSVAPGAGGNLQHKSANQPGIDSLLDQVKELGEQAGNAADGLAKLFLKVVEVAFAGGIDRTKDKHAPGVRDAHKIAETYTKARTGATTWDAKPVKARKLVSTIDSMIKLGMWSKGGQSEPLNTLNKLMTLRMNLRKQGLSKELVDAPNVMLKFARAQVKLESVIPEGELRSYCFIKPTEPRTEEDYWDAMRRNILRVKDGKGGLSESVDVATADALVASITKRLKAIVKSRGVQPADAGTAAREAANAVPAAPAQQPPQASAA